MSKKNQRHPEQPILLTEKEVAKMLGFSTRTLQKWRLTGEGPVFIKATQRAIRYRKDDIQAWIQKRTFTSTSQQMEADRGH